MQVYPEGTHFKIPFIERATIYNIRARPYQIDTTAGSYDLQLVCLFILTYLNFED